MNVLLLMVIIIVAYWIIGMSLVASVKDWD